MIVVFLFLYRGDAMTHILLFFIEIVRLFLTLTSAEFHINSCFDAFFFLLVSSTTLTIPNPNSL
jgi:hypothetical protein